jgi:hypothetical protein
VATGPAAAAAAGLSPDGWGLYYCSLCSSRLTNLQEPTRTRKVRGLRSDWSVAGQVGTVHGGAGKQLVAIVFP